MAGDRVGALTTLGLAGRVAAQNMLAQEAEISTVPYLWTAMFGKSLRYAGNRGARTGAGPRAFRGVIKVFAKRRGGAWTLGRGYEHPRGGVATAVRRAKTGWGRPKRTTSKDKGSEAWWGIHWEFRRP